MMDFVPARLVTGKRDYVEYWVSDLSANGKLCRKRVYLGRIKGLSEKRKFGKRLVERINANLYNGWHPDLKKPAGKQLKTILEGLAYAFEYKRAFIRPRSVPNYVSRLKVFEEWARKHGFEGLKCFEFESQHAVGFMRWLLLVKKVSGRTHNNYLIDFRSFCNLLEKHEFLNSNPFKAVDKVPITAPDKRALTDVEVTELMGYLAATAPEYATICKLCYYCALRPKEICELRVSDVDPVGGWVKVSGKVSKTKRPRLVPVALAFRDELAGFVENKPGGWFLCSTGFKPGPTSIWPQRISDHWGKVREVLGWPGEVKFYSLKDTVAERLLKAGFDIRTVRDLFGHSSVAMTDNYLKGRAGVQDARLMAQFPTL